MLKNTINHSQKRKTQNQLLINQKCENPNLVDIKSIIKEHPKTLHKLSKTIRQAKKVGSNNPLYSDTKFLNEKTVKITKRAIQRGWVFLGRSLIIIK